MIYSRSNNEMVNCTAVSIGPQRGPEQSPNFRDWKDRKAWRRGIQWEVSTTQRPERAQHLIKAAKREGRAFLESGVISLWGVVTSKGCGN